jgi:hypothetical protein
MALIKQSEFAALCGVKRQAVHKWKQEEKLVMAGALVDVDASLAKLGRVRKGGSPVKETLAAEKIVDIDLKPGESLDDAAARLAGDIDVNATSFDEARRIKEVYLALLNRLDYEKKSGALVELALAENVLFEAARAQRDSWLSWPSRIAPLLAAELGIDEADRVTEFLTAHVHKQVAKLGIPDADFINPNN